MAVLILVCLGFLRASMMTVLGQDYIKTARSKGIGEVKVLYQHALKTPAFRW